MQKGILLQTVDNLIKESHQFTSKLVCLETITCMKIKSYNKKVYFG